MPRVTLSIDDACASDSRIAELASRHKIPTVFYWPVEWHSLAYSKGYKPLEYVEAMRIAKHFEIGSHTITHRHLTTLSLEEAKSEIADSKFMLEDIFNTNVDKFCPPRGYTNKELTDYALTFYQSQRLTKGQGLVHIHPDSGANENKPWQKAFHMAGGDVELWGHSWEFNKFNMWEEIEEFFKCL